MTTPQASKVLKGDEITLNCVANGVPQPEIHWLKDGSLIDLNYLDSRFVKLASGSLKISQISSSDEGTYQCRAENSLDSIDAAAFIQVLQRPEFIEKPQNILATEKADIEFNCKVQGEPLPTVQWYKNGELILESEYFQIIKGTNLKILGLVELDSGIYQCVANNEVDNIQAAASLKVIKKSGN